MSPVRASRSLRKRLTWYVVVTLLTMTTLSGIGIYHGTTREIDEVFNATLEQTARMLDGLISLDSIAARPGQLRQALDGKPAKQKYELRLFFVVFDADGKILLSSQRAPDLPARVIKPGLAEFSNDVGKWNTFALESSRDRLLIVVGEHNRVRGEINEYIVYGLLLPLILLLPLVIWLLWQIVGVALRPLQSVTDQVREQDLEQLKPIDVVGVPREISPLVDALNQMILDLEAAYARERRFVSDASHELRNPLASLLINVDNAIEETQDAEALESLQSMKVSIKRLSHLVSQLLALSHLEQADAGAEFEPVELRRVCEHVIAALQPQADASAVTLELEGGKTSCELPGSQPLLESLLTNLVDNAIRYCGRACRVRVRCRREGADLLVVVDDSGPGLDAAQREKATERFYRAGDTNNSGAGLGLSIVNAIAQNHGGRVELSESELGGLCVTIRFQLAR
jgi:two-component system sensor histidine kinase QseC